jgi:general secretion pathway protein E
MSANSQAERSAQVLPLSSANAATDAVDALVLNELATHQLQHWLPTAHAPWRLSFELWTQAEAQRWRVLCAVGAANTTALLSDGAVDSLLRQRIEARLKRGTSVTQVPSSHIDRWLSTGAEEFRALAAFGDGLGGEFMPTATVGESMELSALQLSEQASPVVRLLDSTLYDALQDGASDVHLESTARGLRIRLRIDGVMLDVREVDGTAVAEQIVSRLKVMAELDIGESRLPQDGRFKLRMQGRDIDFRLSVMPTAFGEDAVVRVLDRSQIAKQGHLTLESLGFAHAAREVIKHWARQPHGMLLVSGPTGSGKTTTLYAAISETNTGADKIITIEDPVEYQLAGTVQIPVNEKKGLTFARGLRSVLRHDPDRVMVGEIRDAETAQIAVQAALTGHLVFSTVHANSAFDVIGRFMHMGLDLYSVVSALNAVMSQRLMRLNCSHCTQAFIPSAEVLRSLHLDAKPGERALNHRGDHRYARGVGCVHCRHTGYKGRTAITEMLTLNDALRDLIVARAPIAQLKHAARESGMTSLRHNAVQAVCSGITSFEELERVTSAD